MQSNWLYCAFNSCTSVTQFLCIFSLFFLSFYHFNFFSRFLFIYFHLFHRFSFRFVYVLYLVWSKQFYNNFRFFFVHPKMYGNYGARTQHRKQIKLIIIPFRYILKTTKWRKLNRTFITDERRLEVKLRINKKKKRFILVFSFSFRLLISVLFLYFGFRFWVFSLLCLAK